MDLVNQGKALERLGWNRARPVLVLRPGPSSPGQALAEGTTPWWPRSTRRGVAGGSSALARMRRWRTPSVAINLCCCLNCHVLAGKTSLHEAIDLMALAGRVIANDSA